MAHEISHQDIPISISPATVDYIELVNELLFLDVLNSMRGSRDVSPRSPRRGGRESLYPEQERSYRNPDFFQSPESGAAAYNSDYQFESPRTYARGVEYDQHGVAAYKGEGSHDQAGYDAMPEASVHNFQQSAADGYYRHAPEQNFSQHNSNEMHVGMNPLPAHYTETSHEEGVDRGGAESSVPVPRYYDAQPHSRNYPQYQGPIVDENPFAHQQHQQQQFFYAQQQEMQMRMMQQQQQTSAAWGQGGGQWYNSQAAMHYSDHFYGNPMAMQNAGGYSQGMSMPTYFRSTPNNGSDNSKKIKRVAKREKDKDKPKRPLSAYNLFFKDERAKMIAELGIDDSSEGGKNEDGDDNGSTKKRKADADSDQPAPKKSKGVGFAPMAKKIAAKWKTIDETSLEKYKEMAANDMERYRKEMDAYRKKQRGSLEQTADPEAAETKEQNHTDEKQKDEDVDL